MGKIINTSMAGLVYIVYKYLKFTEKCWIFLKGLLSSSLLPVQVLVQNDHDQMTDLR